MWHRDTEVHLVSCCPSGPGGMPWGARALSPRSLSPAQEEGSAKSQIFPHLTCNWTCNRLHHLPSNNKKPLHCSIQLFAESFSQSLRSSCFET